MTRHEALARENFLSGYNCAQAVFLAFAGELGFTRETAARLASSFGGGVGGMRDLCGALSGIFMAAGLLYGYDSPEAFEEKAAHYARIRTLAEAFRAQYGTILCRELLGLGDHPKPAAPQRRTAEYYQSRPCAGIVAAAARILDEYIAAHPPGAERAAEQINAVNGECNEKTCDRDPCPR